ncbi:hypothetical protein [Ureibacillus sp. FSL W7-1570]|uniref:hypothetical protein n=1 Tax=Ureibacillus sp. FSL W7-1570 TaxID=2954593 RepID=UPI00315A108A
MMLIPEERMNIINEVLRLSKERDYYWEILKNEKHVIPPDTREQCLEAIDEYKTRIFEYLASLNREDLLFIMELVNIVEKTLDLEMLDDYIPNEVIAQLLSVLGDFRTYLEKGLEKILVN